MIRSEKLERFLLGYSLEIPDGDGNGRSMTFTQLLNDVNRRCLICDQNELLDALYNLNPEHAVLQEYFPNVRGFVSFEKGRRLRDWRQFFMSGEFNIKPMPGGRKQFEQLSTQLEQTHSSASADYSKLTDYQLQDLAINSRIPGKKIMSASGESYVWDRDYTIEQLVKRDAENSIHQDRKFSRMAIEEARKSISEDDRKPHPRVGAVVVKNGQVLSVAHRGEAAGNHAEFVALEKKLSGSRLLLGPLYTLRWSLARLGIIPKFLVQRG